MSNPNKMVPLELTDQIWNRLFTVHSLVVIGSREDNGDYNLAPKHMAMPLGFENYFGFMGTSRKSTYHNIKREGVFTVSYPRPSQLIVTSLAASPREDDHTKPIVKKLPTSLAREIDGEFLDHSYLQLECKLDQILGQFGEWELIVGEVVAAYAHPDAVRKKSVDDNDLIFDAPLLAYLHPDRYAIVNRSQAFPLPKNFKR
ncbi:MAG: flavin reductase [Balneolaceae bacterium]|nr:flavin reductase [Balneolaceae bacterium]